MFCIRARLYRLRKNALYEGHGFSPAVKYRAGAALAAEVRFFTVIPCRHKLGKTYVRVPQGLLKSLCGNSKIDLELDPGP
jgi:hypothetical protein